MKLSKIAALFMVPVLALCLVACSAPGGIVSESASSVCMMIVISSFMD